MTEIQRKMEEAFRKMEAIVKRAESENRNITKAERDEHDAFKGEIEVLIAQQRTMRSHEEMRVDLYGGAIEPGSGSLTMLTGDIGPHGEHRTAAAGRGGLVFETRDGRKVEALPLGRRFADLEEKKPEFSEIGPGTLGKVIRAKILGDYTSLSETERRAFGEGTGSLGGFFVPSLVSGYVIDLARNAACVLQAGAWTLPMDGPEITLVKVLSDPTGHWVGEHVAITESTGSFGPVTLKAMVLGALVRISVALLEDAKNSGTTIENMLSAALGLELDRVCLLGNGTNEPKGLLNCADINTYSMGANGLALANYDPFSYAVQYVFEDNGTPEAVIYAPRTAGALDRLKEATTNAPLAPPPSFQALKKFQTNQIPITQTQGTATAASSAFVGDYKNLVIGIRRQIAIDFSPHAGTGTFAQVETLIRAYMRVDVAVLRENHFTWVKGIL